MEALLDLSKTPGADVGIVAIGSQRACCMTMPRLTVVTEDTEAMGKLGAETLLARLEDSDAEARQVVVAPKLIIGATSKP